MKRCPQCDFLYEEDQQLCDMDGTELFPDSAFLLEQGSKAPGSRSLLKLLVEVAVPLVVLAFVGFYAFRYQARTHNSTPASAIVVNEASSSDVKPANSFSNSVEASADDVSTKRLPGAGNVDQSFPEPIKGSKRTEAAKNSPSEPGSSTANTRTPAKLTNTENALRSNTSAPGRSISPTSTRPKQPQPNPQKKDNRVTSLLKKTGRFLIKPFRT